MRTFSNTNYKANYPDLVEMAFDTIGINVQAQNPSQNPTFNVTVLIGDTQTGKFYTDTRAALNGEVSFDLAPYVRALMTNSMSNPFEANANGYLPLTGAYAVEVSVGASNLFLFTFDAIWGTVPMGEKWNADKVVRMWSGYPNIYGLYVGNGTTFNGKTYNTRGIITNQVPKDATTLFAMTGYSPWTFCQRSEDHKTLTTYGGQDIPAGITLTTEIGEFDRYGNVLQLAMGQKSVLTLTAPKGWNITGWSITLSGSAGQGFVYAINSKGESTVINSTQTFTTTDIETNEDHLIFRFDQLQGGLISITDFSVNLHKEYDLEILTGKVTAEYAGFITFQRTGRMSLLGVNDKTALTFKEENACGVSIFLRWIGQDGFPVSWLFRHKEPSRQVKASDALRSSMNGTLIDNGVNGAVQQVDSKSETVTLTAAYPLATAEEYDILRGLLLSPVVEAWNAEREYWYRVNIEDGTFNRSGAKKEDFEFKIILPAEEAQQL